MEKFNFNEVHERRGTGALKWDGMHGLLADTTHTIDEDIIPLWVADMDFKAPEALIRAMHDCSEQGIYSYQTIPEELKSYACKWIKNMHNWSILEKGLLFSNGVCLSILTNILALTSPEDEILYFSPLYGPIRKMIVDFERTPLVYKPDMDGERFELDFEAIEALISHKTKMLILCNPHNPGGTLWTREELTKLAKICIKHKIIICSNDIHADLIYSDSIYTPIASLDKEISYHTITHLSPSKTFNLGGQKVSHMYTENKAYRDKIQSMNVALLGHQPFTNFGVDAFRTVYTQCTDWYKELMVYLEDNRNFAYDFIQHYIPQIRAMKPKGTYLMWLDCTNISDDESVLMNLFVGKAKVLLSNGSFFGEGGHGYMRLNFACPRKILTKGLERIRDVVQAHTH